MNRLLRLCILSVCLLAVCIPTLSSTVSADQDLVIYTDYYQYDNNESLKYHIVGTNNTTYTVVVFHRDSDAPLTITYKRTGINETVVNGSIPLYEFTTWGVMEIVAFNKSHNQSAKCEFRLVPSQAWWEDEVDEMVSDFWITVWQIIWILGTALAIPVGIMFAFLITYRDKMKATSGELTISERMGLEDLWNYDDYANDVCARNPHSPSERARLKYSLARSLFFQVVAAKKKMGVYRQLDEKEKELSARIPKLVNDVLDALVNEGVISKKERKEMKGGERFKLLNPGQKRVEL